MSSADFELAYIRLSDAGLTPDILAHIGNDPYLAQRIVELTKEHTANAHGDLRNAYSTNTHRVIFNGSSFDWEEVMEWQIKDIPGLTLHSRTTLAMQGITRLRTLTSMSMAQLDGLYNIGPKSVANITAVLRSMGLSLLGKTIEQGVVIRIGARPNDWMHIVSRQLLLELDIRDLTPPKGWNVHSYLLQHPISKVGDLMHTNSHHWHNAFEAHVLAHNQNHGEANGFINPSTTDTVVWLNRLQEELL